MNRLLKEMILWIFIVMPYVYLLIIWNGLPEKVAVHFDLHGNANRWAGKTTLLIPATIGIAVYSYFVM